MCSRDLRTTTGSNIWALEEATISLEQHYCPSKEDREAEGDSGGSLWGLLEGSLPEEISGAAAAGREGE